MTLFSALLLLRVAAAVAERETLQLQAVETAAQGVELELVAPLEMGTRHQ
jgi:hypothetical protein